MPKTQLSLIVGALSFLFLMTAAYASERNHGRFNAANCIGQDANVICTAVGFSIIDDKTYPIVTQSFDGGLTYRTIMTPVSTTEGSLLSVKCRGEKEQALCVAVGYTGTDREHSKPLILQTTLGAQVWQAATIDEPATGLLNKVSCVDKATTMTCYATGWGPNNNPTFKQAPILLQSDAGVNAWHKIHEADQALPKTGLLNGISCIGEVNHSHCVAIGYDDILRQPFIISNDYQDKHWQIETIKNNSFDETSTLEDIDCVADFGGSCRAVGHSGSDLKHMMPLLIRHHFDWSRVFFSIPNQWPGKLTSTVCIKGEENPSCIAAGTAATHQQFGYGLLVDDTVIQESMLATVNFKNITCTATGDFCVAVGTKGHPYLIQSTNKGKSWGFKAIDNVPMYGELRAASCSDNSPRTICLAVGYEWSLYDDRGQPLLVQTTNGGLSWQVKNILDS